MIIHFIYVVLGFVILFASSDLLVKNAVHLSIQLGVPIMIISLTIVSFGTSLPELIVAIEAVLDHVSGIALGNVVGSNIMNILLVLAVPALFVPFKSQGHQSQKSYVIMMAASVLFVLMCYIAPIRFWHGLVLITAMGLVLWDHFRDIKNHNNAIAIEHTAPTNKKAFWQLGGCMLIGFIGLPLGGKILIHHTSEIAIGFGLSQTVIGLTLVAFGTSLPELSTTIVAALKKQTDMIIGNVIGSNIFNILAIIGISSLFGNINVSDRVLNIDIWVMFFAGLLLLPFIVLNWSFNRLWGGFMIVLCCGYIAFNLTLTH